MEEATVPSFKRRPHLTKEQRLPKYIKDTEKVLRAVKSCQSNFKTLMANSRLRGQHYKKVYSLTFNVLKHYDYIQAIIEKAKLLQKEQMLRREIASILIYEILFGTGNLTGESKPVLTILKYKTDIMHNHQELQQSGDIKINALNIPHYARVHTIVTTVPYVIKDLESEGYQQIFYNEHISEKEYLELVRSLKKKTFLVDLHFKDLLVFAFNENLVQLQLYSKGHIFLQDKSSYIPVHALNPEPGSAVLDACAAPGMKSVHLAAKMQNKGLLMAFERNAERFETLKEMLQYGAVKISKIFCKDFTLVDPNDQAYSSIDYILLDPSCSGSGMVNRMDQVTTTEDSKDIKERLQKLAGFQIILLKHALKFPSVKRVVYSTCSINEEENEYVVHEVLHAFSNTFKLVPVLPKWPVRGSKDYEFGELCVRTVSEKHLTNGFFVAMFERLDHSEQCKNYISQKKSKTSKLGKKDYSYDKSAKNFYKASKSDITSKSYDSRVKLMSSELTEMTTSSEIFNTHNVNSVSKRKSKKVKSESLTESEEIKDIIDISINSPVKNKKLKHKTDSDRNNLSVEQEMDLQYQNGIDSFGKVSVKAKKIKKHKHSENLNTNPIKTQSLSTVQERDSFCEKKCNFFENTKSKDKKYFQSHSDVKNEDNCDFSNSHLEVKNNLCTDINSSNYGNVFHKAKVENNSIEEPKIPQSLYSINETADSIQDHPKEHKKSKKHKKYSEDSSDIYNNDDVIIECVLDKNSSIENMVQETKLENSSAEKAKICQSLFHLNGTVDSNEVNSKKHKKSKKYKRHSEDKRDICSNADVIIECVLDKNTSSLENMFHEAKLGNSSTEKSKIYQPLFSLNETVDSVEGNHKKHKKNKKHKKYSGDKSDVCSSGDVIIEYASDENTGSLENYSAIHKKSKHKNSLDCTNYIQHDENQITGDVLEMKRKKKHKSYPADLLTDMCSSKTVMTHEEEELVITSQIDESKCKRRKSQILPFESNEKQNFLNVDDMKHKKSKKHKKHSQNSFDESQEVVNSFGDSKMVASSCAMPINVPSMETASEKYHIENVLLGNESGEKHKSKKNKHNKHSQDYFDNS